MSSEFIYIVILGTWYVYLCYQHFKLEKLVLKQLSAVWQFQHNVVDTLDMLSREIEEIKNSETKDE